MWIPWLGLANTYAALRRTEDALAYYRRALAVDPNRADALGNRAAVLFGLRRFAEALADAEADRRRSPNGPMRGGFCSVAACIAAIGAILKRSAPISPSTGTRRRQARDPAFCTALGQRSRKRTCTPCAGDLYRARGISGAAAAVARSNVTRTTRSASRICRPISHAHATALLMAGVFEHHDKSRFEIDCALLRPGRWQRYALAAWFARSIASSMPWTRPTHDIAELMRKENEIDIAVDLKASPRNPARHPFASSRADAGSLSGFSRTHGRALYRLSAWPTAR